MSWYKKYILPKLLGKAMASEEIARLRPGVVEQARGVVLEIGAGPGYNIPLYKNVSKLYALEPSPELVAMARERAQNAAFTVEFLSADAEHIPLPDDAVDTVVSTWTMCSVHNPPEVLREVRRVLKPGGRFVFIDHGLSPRPFTSVVQRLLTPLTKWFTGNCHMDRDIERLIRDAGFTINPVGQFHEPGHPLIYNTKGVAAA